MRTDVTPKREVADPGDLPDLGIDRELPTHSFDLLVRLELAELRLRWLSAYGVEPLQRLSREFLARSIFYHAQEDAHGGLSKKVLRRLERVAEATGLSGRPNDAVVARTGTRLLREWQGKVHEVMVVQDGFLWGGKTYTSLSEIARLITGTRWSGPRFFGLRGASKEIAKRET